MSKDGGRNDGEGTFEASLHLRANEMELQHEGQELDREKDFLMVIRDFDLEEVLGLKY